MDGTNKARRNRWIKRAEAAFERMFEGKGEELGERAVTTRVGRIRMQRQRWECPKCRIAFFPAGRSTGLGDGRL